jgi:hypothetical protein
MPKPTALPVGPVRLLPVLLPVLLAAGLWLRAPGPAGAQDAPELTRLVDCPTAGLVAKGRFGMDLRLFPQGGVLGQLQAGVLKRMAIGLSFGGEHIVGAGDIDWYPRLEPAVRYRLVEENSAWPAVTLGFETQGFGGYRGSRYEVKSKGVFVALSKNYESGLGQFGVHGGANLSREDRGGDGDVSGWVGVDKSVNPELSVVAEYDLGFNDNGTLEQGADKGYLNAGVYWSAVPSLSVGLVLKDLLENRRGADGISRELTVRYTEEFR